MTKDKSAAKEPAQAEGWLNPFEAGRHWIELAAKLQSAMTSQVTRQTEKGPLPFSPEVATQAFSEFFAHVLSNPVKLAEAQGQLWAKHAELWKRVLTNDPKELESAAKAPRDRRFQNPEWDTNVALNVIKHSYLIGSEWLKGLVAEQSNLSPSIKKQVEFFTQQYIDAMAPTNSPVLNPDVVRKTLDTGGTNLIRGFSNLLDDVSVNAGHVRRVAPDAFELGRNIAATKGSVVLRTDMMELLQYEPTTDKVRQRPLLLVPPWVNKFYLFDLQPKTSFIKWAVDQGYTVFAISWINPDESHANKDFENYWLEGPMAALDAMATATGERQANIVSYCLGGSLTAAGLGHMAARGDDRVTSATLIATLTDFEKFGDFEVFVTDEHVQALEKHVSSNGHLDSSDLTRLFSILRANDLIWSSAISSYLLADETVQSDILYWFADGIGMPGKMLSTFTRKIILENGLTKPGVLTIDGTPIDLKKVDVPLFFVSLRDDHVSHWQDTYRGARRFNSLDTFILGGSGHNAGTINPPAARKHGYWTNKELVPDPQTWFNAATRHDGSWWPEWSVWLAERSGPEVAARPVVGGPLPILEPAPGSYARQRR